MSRWQRRLRNALAAGLFLLVAVPPLQVLALRFVDPPLTLTMIEATVEWRQERGEWRFVRHAPVDLDRVGERVPRAVVASEDARFWLHHGFDWKGICRALRHNRDRKSGERPVGGSTITQQTARNVFLWQEPSWLRKGLETYYATWMELLLPKERILEVYLGVAETGLLTFGVESGAERYFGVPAADLSADQAARLAAVLPAPRSWEIDGRMVRVRSGFVRQNPAPWPGDPGFERAAARYAADAADGRACVLSGGR